MRRAGRSAHAVDQARDEEDQSGDGEELQILEEEAADHQGQTGGHPDKRGEIEDFGHVFFGKMHVHDVAKLMAIVIQVNDIRVTEL
jgi:hypothetical protein